MNDKKQTNKSFNIPGLMLRNEKGMVLIVSMVLMLVITVMGILALSTSTTDVMMAGNQRMKEVIRAASEGGKQVAQPIINDVADDGNLNSGFEKYVPDKQGLENEIYLGDSDADGDENKVSTHPASIQDAIANPDIDLKEYAVLKDLPVTVDIDLFARNHVEGSGAEFGEGVDGIANKSILRYYKVNSITRGQVGSVTAVGAVYRHVKDK